MSLIEHEYIFCLVDKVLFVLPLALFRVWANCIISLKRYPGNTLGVINKNAITKTAEKISAFMLNFKIAKQQITVARIGILAEINNKSTALIKNATLNKNS
jgi:wyosine [tRNA(Phe)-imidazoG37] synthetase (radical SAM superfamily)